MPSTRIRMMLLQNSTHTKITCITDNTSLQCAIKYLQCGIRTQATFQCIKSTLLLYPPHKWLTLASQQRQRRRYFRKSQHKFAIIITKTKKLLNLIHISWHRPLLHRINLSLFHTNSRSIYNMPQKGHTLQIQMTLGVLKKKFMLC